MNAESKARDELVAFIYDLEREAAACDAEALIAWPGDTQFDGGEEEVAAAALEVHAQVNREHSRRLARVLEMLS